MGHPHHPPRPHFPANFPPNRGANSHRVVRAETGFPAVRYGTPEPPPPGALGLPALSRSGETEDSLWRYTIRQLGGGVTDVELTRPGDRDPYTNELIPEGESDRDDCIKDSRRWYAYRVGFVKIVSIYLANRQSAYLMPPECVDVIDMWLPSFQLPSLDADQFSYTYFSLLFGQWTNPNVAPLPYSDLVQRLQYLATIGRVFSSDRDFEYDPRTRILEILPPPAAIGSFTGFPFGREVRALITIWSNAIDVTSLDPMELDFFKRKLLAKGHFTLGNKRMKFEETASAGGNVRLNGEKLIEISKEMEEKLEKDVILWKRSVPLISG
jgi:hypothetical protein